MGMTSGGHDSTPRRPRSSAQAPGAGLRAPGPRLTAQPLPAALTSDPSAAPLPCSRNDTSGRRHADSPDNELCHRNDFFLGSEAIFCLGIISSKT